MPVSRPTASGPVLPGTRQRPTEKVLPLVRRERHAPPSSESNRLGRLDAALEHEALSRSLALLTGELDQDPERAEELPSILGVLPPEQEERLEQNEALFAEWIRLRRTLVNMIGPEAAPWSAGGCSLAESFYNPQEPPEVSLLHLSAVRADLAAFALGAAAIRKRTLPAWLAASLTDAILEGARAGAILMASVPALNADPKIIRARRRRQDPLASPLPLSS